MPVWCNCVSACSITRLVKWCFDGRKYRNLAESDNGALCIHPLHLSNTSLPKNNRCHTKSRRGCDCCKLCISAEK